MRLLRFIRLLPIKLPLFKPTQLENLQAPEQHLGASAPLPPPSPATLDRLNDDIPNHLDGYKDHLSRCYAAHFDC
jgi:hypothetical protein